MYELKPSLALSRVPGLLNIATSEDTLHKIWELREVEYSKLYPEVTCFQDDVYDQEACVLYSAKETGEVISTGRVAFDGELGLPADELVKPAVDQLRASGKVIAEPSKFAISREAQGALPSYLLTYYEIGITHSIDSLVFICRSKSNRFYEKAVGANVLVKDIGYSYGTNEPFSFLEWDVKRSKPFLEKFIGEKLP
jgi:hypothetical protein